jgi:hypothetical protein
VQARDRLAVLERVTVQPEQSETCRLWLHNVGNGRNEEAFVFTLTYV